MKKLFYKIIDLIPPPPTWVCSLSLLYFFFLCSFNEVKPSTVGVVFYSDVTQSQKVEIFDQIKGLLEKQYNVRVDSVPGFRSKPKWAYYEPRKRWRADSLLIDLTKVKNYGKVIGVTTKDISCTKEGYVDWGIMGLAYEPGRTCVISTERLDGDIDLLNSRLRKVALHELGHTFGLVHCADTHCYMDGGSDIDNDKEELCEKCAEKLKELLK